MRKARITVDCDYPTVTAQPAPSVGLKDVVAPCPTNNPRDSISSESEAVSLPDRRWPQIPSPSRSPSSIRRISVL
jgi:hypothetical protein